MKKLFLIGVLFIVAAWLVFHFISARSAVVTLENLIGRGYAEVQSENFYSEPDEHYSINVNQPLNELHGGILHKKPLLTDSLVQVYTWKNVTHTTTLWVGKTSTAEDEVIDAIRYRYDVRF